MKHAITPAHLLIVDDDPRICRMLQRYLEREGYRVSCSGDGQAMRQVLEEDPPLLVLLDLGLPGEDGLSLAAELRQRGSLGIIIVSGKGEAVDRIVGLEVGADDYVCKPFEQRELLARVRSVLRRMRDTPARSTAAKALCFRAWKLDLEGRSLSAPDGTEVVLTGQEFDLLAILAGHHSRVFDRDDLMDQVCGREWTPGDRSIDILVTRLRQKLRSRDPEVDFIKSIRNIGYKFTVVVKPG